MSPTPDRIKIRSLHGLRGLMAWWVVIGHVSLGLGWTLPLIDKNTLAVDVFILLSGFVIAMLVDRKAESYLTYITRRAFRLFPLYLPALTISAILLPVQLFAWRSLVPTNANNNRIILTQEALTNLPTHLGAHLFLIQGLIPKAFGGSPAYTIIGQAWSISLEWQFYLIAPFIISMMIHRRWLMALAIMLAIAALAPLFSSAFLGAKILLFGVGIATHLALKPGYRLEALIAAVICAIASIAIDGALQFIPLGIWVAVIASSICPVHSLAHRLAKLLGSPALFQMGEVSYSIYLLHMIPLYVSVYACTILHISGLQTQIIVTLSTIVLTYLGAVGCYHLVEKPGIKAGAWITRRRATAPTMP